MVKTHFQFIHQQISFISRFRIIKLIAFSIIIIPAIFLHAQTFKRPFIGHHDFLNAHLMTTALVFRKEGIIKHFFAPTYTFTPDMQVNPRLGVRGKNNYMYYVSYPPFIFIFTYFLARIPFIGLTSMTPKIASLLVFVSCFIMLLKYLKDRYGFSETMLALAVFSIFPISAYFLGSVFFVDIAILPLWLASFILFQRLTRKIKRSDILLFFLLLFFISFTEWFGLFLSGSVFLLVLFARQSWNWELKFKLGMMLGLIIIPLFALFLTFFIFSHQIEYQTLKDFMMAKLFIKSNAGIFSNYQTFKNYLSDFYARGIFHIQLGYGQYIFIILTILLVGLTVFFKKLHNLVGEGKLRIYLTFFVTAPLIHFLVFNQFHLEHDFGFLYFYFIIIFMFVWFYKIIKEYLEQYCPKYYYPGSFLLFTLIISLLILNSLPSYKTYFKDWVYSPEFFPIFYENMRKNTSEHDLILTNFVSSPMSWFYLQRNVIGEMIGENVVRFQNPYPNIKNIFYMTNTYDSAKVSCGNKTIDYKDLLFICRLN